MPPLPAPRRRPGALTAAFVLLTVAAVTLGVLVVRHAVGLGAGPSTGSGPSAGVTAPSSDTAATSGPVPAGTVLLDLAAYTGRPVDAVDGELRGQGLRTALRTTSGAAPSAPAGCAVTDISPAGAVRTGTTVTITCAPR